MDKEEYHQKLDELTGYVREKDYENALKVVEEVDWRRVKSINTLNMVADVYEVNKDYAKTKEILVLARSRASIGRGILGRLVEVCLKLGEIDEAERYFREYSKVAKNDNNLCLLQYKLYKAKKAPLQAQIDVLEDYKDREYTERWAYELAALYAKAGDTRKCIDTCDDLILWFSEGRYVKKAMELKMRYAQLSPSQQSMYDKMKLAYSPAGDSQSLPELPEESGASQDASVRANAWVNARRDRTQPLPAVKPAEKEPVSEVVLPEQIELPESEEPEEKAEPEMVLGEEPKGAVQEAEAAATEAAEDIAKAAAATAAGVSAAAGDLKEKIARSFLSVFGRDDDDEDEEDMVPEEPEFRRSVADTGTLVLDEPDEGVLKVRDLENEELSLDAVPGDVRPEAEPAEESAAEPEEFNLEKFLSETAGSFSEEIAAGNMANTTDEAPAAEGEVIEDMEPDASEDAPAEEPSETREYPEMEAGELFIPEMDEEPVEAAASFAEVSDAAGFAEEEDEPVPEAEPEAEEEAAVPEEDTFAEEEAEEEPVQAEAAEDEAAPEEILETAEDEADTEAEADADAQEDVSEDTPEMEEADEASEEAAEEPAETVRKPHYIEELEVPDPEPTPEERRTRTIPLNLLGQNTVPISIDKILSEETPEERRIRILNKAKPTRMSEEQRKIFTYFARVPGMDSQILEAIGSVYEHAGEKTSLHGNIAVMGAVGTGKSRLSEGLVLTMCQDLGMEAAKVARVNGEKMNGKDPASIVNKMAGGFLMIEDVSRMEEQTVEKLSQAMEFRTDCMIMIIEDEKNNMRAFLKKYPQFAAKFDKVISIPVFTNDELITFARTYATENDCKIDDMAILALYTSIGNSQTEEEPVTISRVKDMIDKAISHATKGRRPRKGGKDKTIILRERDFDLS